MKCGELKGDNKWATRMALIMRTADGQVLGRELISMRVLS